MPFISLLLLVSIQETLRSVDLIFLLATGHLRKLMKATDTLSNSHSTKLYLQFQGHQRPSESHPRSTGNGKRFDHSGYILVFSRDTF